MKRLLATLLAAVLLLACIPAMAEDGASGASFIEELGMDMDMSRIQEKAHNFAKLEREGVISREPYGAMVTVVYFAIPQDVWEALGEIYHQSGNEDKVAIDNAVNPLKANIGLIVIADTDDLHKVGLRLDDTMKVEEVTTQGKWRYFFITLDTDSFLKIYDDPKAIGLEMTADESRAEREAVVADIEMIRSEVKQMLKSGEHVEPVDPRARLVGQKIEFETTDLDGNPVKSADLFKDNKITMLNAWGTWCPSCVGEFPRMAQTESLFREKGCGIVGLEFENHVSVNAFKEKSEAIRADAGVSFPNVLLPEENPIFQQITGFPTSYFVDSEGTILAYPVVGPHVSEYESTLFSLLSGDEVEVPAETGATASGSGRYTVYVYDKDGNPVEGAFIQLCDDSTCALQPTDANGAAVFNVSEPKAYEVHVLKAPEGFRQDEQAYKTLDTYSDVSIFLDRAE